MKSWSRTIPFTKNDNRTEVWTNNITNKKHTVKVTLGKPMDILSLKSDIIENFRVSVRKVKEPAIALFSNEKNLEPIDFCVVCGGSKSIPCFSVYGATYVQCTECSHCYLTKHLTEEALNEFYVENTNYSSTYTNKEAAQLRLKQVAKPKAKWVIEQYEKVYGRKPVSILDVGAGGGHFVKACRDLGIKADGLELSESSRKFCKEVFNVELIKADFLRENNKFGVDYEIITFWGLIEHVKEPLKMLKTASKMLDNNKGLVVAAVPRWDCFGTTVQEAFKDTIIRHLSPLTHIHCFTDLSLATAFEESEFEIVAAWYLGMDAYELIIQLSNHLNDRKVIEELGGYIPKFQKQFDLSRLSDEMVFVGKSVSKNE